MATDQHMSRPTSSRRWWRERSDGPASILLVEDDASYRATIRALLVEAPYEITEAADGAEALRILRERSPERPIALVITDILMPKLDGLSLITEIRQIDPNLKILAISAGSRAVFSDMLRAALNAGATAALKKPFRREQLLQQVEKLLD